MHGPGPTLGDGRYIIRRELGRGTMGVVYEAEDTVLARTVAVKTIELAFAAAEAAAREFEQRFFTEARVAARLSHPGIVVCHDVGKDPASGKLFIVFEYLRGRTLADRLVEGPMGWREALEIVVRVARAIHHAHEHGVVHRDLKPANIMLLDPGTSGASTVRTEAAVKIMDFGVARLESLGERLTRPGQSFGTPLYMSPEQALGQPSSARSDIFSLGSVLCTMLLGRPWFDAPSVAAIVGRVVHDDPPLVSSLRAELPASLDPVVATALARREGDRYATAADMADDLEEVLVGKAPKHAEAAVASRPLPAPAEDALLAGLTVPLGPARAAPGTDALAALLEDLPLIEEASVSGPAAVATATIPRPPAAGAASPPAARSGRRWLVVPAAALVVVAVLALVPRRRPPAASVAPPAIQESAPVRPSPTASATAPPVAPTITAPAATSPAASSPAAIGATVPAVAPRGQTAGTPRPSESPSTGIANAAAGGAARSPGEPAKSRIRLSLEHPFEDGRLSVWIDGVFVYETKLEAPVSKRIVAFKVHEGRAEKLLDVEPGRHEVRVEVRWDQDHRMSTKVVDVAAGATGLLEVRVGRMSHDLSLAWSRLARD